MIVKEMQYQQYRYREKIFNTIYFSIFTILNFTLTDTPKNGRFWKFSNSPISVRGFPKLPTAGIRISIRLWDVKTGQQKAKLNSRSHYIMSVNFSPDGSPLASGSGDNSIRLWNVKTLKEILQSDSSYKDLLTQFKLPLQNSSLLPNVNPDRTILRICQNPIFEASGTLILQGQFINHQRKDLKPLLKSKGSCILEDLKNK